MSSRRLHITRAHVLLGLLLIAAGGMHYSDWLIAALTGWPIDLAYGIGQAGGEVLLWAVAGALAAAVLPSRTERVLGTLITGYGAAESLLRASCLAWQAAEPVAIAAGQTVCEAHTGLDIYALGLAVLAVLASLLGAWAAQPPADGPPP